VQDKFDYTQQILNDLNNYSASLSAKSY